MRQAFGRRPQTLAMRDPGSLSTARPSSERSCRTTSGLPAAVQILPMRAPSSDSTRSLADRPSASRNVSTERRSSSGPSSPPLATSTEAARSSTTPRRRLLAGDSGRLQMCSAWPQCALAESRSPRAPQTMPRFASVRQSSWCSSPKCPRLMERLLASSCRMRSRSPSSPQAKARLLSVMAVSTWPAPKCRSSMSRLHSRNSRALGTSPSSP
mmetsp:Transcript_60681/g.172483  ORF Transcript_60681/g.172483 Transcript_60681/m.172483 type:complete len:212 (+) Transcript_60681:87-722(+)